MYRLLDQSLTIIGHKKTIYICDYVIFVKNLKKLQKFYYGSPLVTLHRLTGCEESCISWVSAKWLHQCLTCLVCIIGYDQSSKYGASNIQQFRKKYAQYWLQYLTNSCFTMKKSYNYMVEISWLWSVNFIVYAKSIIWIVWWFGSYIIRSATKKLQTYWYCHFRGTGYLKKSLLTLSFEIMASKVKGVWSLFTNITLISNGHKWLCCCWCLLNGEQSTICVILISIFFLFFHHNDCLIERLLEYKNLLSQRALNNQGIDSFSVPVE